MPLTFFCPNAKKEGSILRLTFNSKDAKLFVGFTKQTDWNDQDQMGIFKGGLSTGFFLNRSEMAELYNILNIDQGILDKTHIFDNNKSRLRFLIDKSQGEKRGFILEKDNNIYKALLPSGEHLTIKLYLEFCFDRMFNAIYAADKKEFESKHKEQSENVNPIESAPF